MRQREDINPTWRKKPKGEGDLVLYLDFDGVLHHENCLWHPRRGPYVVAPESNILFQHAPLLEEVLKDRPEVRIVLSTSWVRQYGCSKSAKRLPQSLRERVIGATFHSGMNEELFTDAPRGMQVWGDVVRRKPRDWIALDDDYLHWPKWCLDKYVQTNERQGISDPVVLADLKAKLSKLGT